MKFLLSSLIFALCLSSFSWLSFQPIKKGKQFIIQGTAQGTTYQLKYIAYDTVISKNEIDSVLNSIDSSFSLYKNYSLINTFNKKRTCTQINRHFFNVMHVALQVADESNGSFDPTVKPLSNIWGFGINKHKIHSTPSSKLIQCTLSKIGYHSLTLTSSEICKLNPHIQIDCDGIAQGYSVDVLAAFLENAGIREYLIELGGEIMAAGTNADYQHWTIGIEDPMFSESPFITTQKKIQLQNEAITTSGNYRKYIKLGDEYFSHIIDPKEGRPVNNGIISVSVISQDAIHADAWDNAYMILGIKKSFQIAESQRNTGVYFIYRDEQGNIKDTCNNYFKSKIIQATS